MAASYSGLTQNMAQRCLILFGAPGSGKGTQAKLLKDGLGWAHISTGDMLREHVAKRTPMGVEIEELMRAGALVPDAMVNRLVEVRITEPDCQAGFILDGYPRTVAQAALVVSMLGARGVTPVVIHLKVDYNIIVARLASRRVCSQCGSLYSVASNAPIVTETCDYCGGKLIRREDDAPETIWKRLHAFDNQTFPVLDFLTGAGFRAHEIDGSAGSPQIIMRRISALVE
jgi:adenylate kinase